MSEYNSRINICVSSIRDWTALEDLDMQSYGFTENPFPDDKLELCIASDWAITESELFELVTNIADRLGTHCVVISDTTNLSVDPYDYFVCYLGDDVRDGYVEVDGFDINDFFFETDIDFDTWLAELVNTGSLELNEDEENHLEKFEIYPF